MGVYIHTRILEGKIAYKVYITVRHHNIQIIVYEPMTIAKSVQELIYDLTTANLVEKVSN
jgi:hypothetical protein